MSSPHSRELTFFQLEAKICTRKIHFAFGVNTPLHDAVSTKSQAPPLAYTINTLSRVFPVGVNVSDTHSLRLCVTCVKGQFRLKSGPDSPLIVRSPCVKTAKEAEEAGGGRLSSRGYF